MQCRDNKISVQAEKVLVRYDTGPNGEQIPIYQTRPKKPLTSRPARYGGCGEPVLVRPAGC